MRTSKEDKNLITMVDIPERTESHGPVFIYGVEGEQIEEENDAYNDLRYDIGQCSGRSVVESVYFYGARIIVCTSIVVIWITRYNY